MAVEDKMVVVERILASPELGVTDKDFQAKLFDKAFDVLKRMSSKVVNKYKACYRKNFKLCKLPIRFVKVAALLRMLCVAITCVTLGCVDVEAQLKECEDVENFQPTTWTSEQIKVAYQTPTKYASDEEKECVRFFLRFALPAMEPAILMKEKMRSHSIWSLLGIKWTWKMAMALLLVDNASNVENIISNYKAVKEANERGEKALTKRGAHWKNRDLVQLRQKYNDLLKKMIQWRTEQSDRRRNFAMWEYEKSIEIRVRHNDVSDAQKRSEDAAIRAGKRKRDEAQAVARPPPQPSLQEIWTGMEKEDAGNDSDDEYFSLCEDADESMPTLGGVDSSTSSDEPLEGAASQVVQC